MGRRDFCANCFVWFTDFEGALTERKPCRNPDGPCERPDAWRRIAGALAAIWCPTVAKENGHADTP